MRIDLSLTTLAVILTSLPSTSALQSLLPKLQIPNFGLPNQQQPPTPKTTGNIQLEDALLSAINSSDDRLTNSAEISSLVTQLEESATDYSIPRPAISPQVMGRWRLLHTTNADTASPIQRKAVDATKYNIYQDIMLRKTDKEERLIVSQVVKFGESTQLIVDALASTSTYPLEELTQRETTGKVLGLNILGVSLVGEEALPDPDKPDSRIDFVFDEGKFEFGNGFTIPYPVPFRNPLFRDWVKGWIDVTYLSDRVRISRGNKGTTFVLVKEEDEEAEEKEE